MSRPVAAIENCVPATLQFSHRDIFAVFSERLPLHGHEMPP
jgi:hypothetical protein